jgi:hypothetical protein
MRRLAMAGVLGSLGHEVASWIAGTRTRPGDPPRQDATPGVEGVTELHKLIEQTEGQRQEVQFSLHSFTIHRAPWREAARLLVLGALLSDLTTLSRLLRKAAPRPDRQLVADLGQSLARLHELLHEAREAAKGGSQKAGFYRHAYRETAWALVLELRVALLELGDTCYLVTRLQEEQQWDTERDRLPDANKRWSDLYDPAELHELLGALRGDGERRPDGSPGGQSAVRSQAIEMLTRLYQERSDDDREHRAQEMLRVARVRGTCWVLGPAMLGLAVLYSAVIPLNWGWEAVRLVGLALVPAAAGGALGSIRKLREERLESRSGEKARYMWTFAAQLLISGTLGLIVLALADLQILPGFQAIQAGPQAGTVDWQDDQNLVILSLYGFVAGFSEAFALNLLQRFMTGGVI